jgi:hypothetical protein
MKAACFTNVSIYTASHNGSQYRRQDRENLKFHVRMKNWNILNALTWPEICAMDFKKCFIMDPRGGEPKCLLVDFKCSSMPVSCVLMCMRNFSHRHVCTTRHCNAAISRLKGSKLFYVALGIGITSTSCIKSFREQQWNKFDRLHSQGATMWAHFIVSVCVCKCWSLIGLSWIWRW